MKINLPEDFMEKTAPRTLRQNSAIHAYVSMVAKELENQGQTIQDVVKKVDWCEITPTKQSVKETLWRPIQEATLGKKSTTELETNEVTKVYEIMSMFLAKQFNISIPFPSQEETESYLQSYDNT